MSGTPARRSAQRMLAMACFIGAPALLAVLAALNGLHVLDTRSAVAEREIQLSAFQRKLDAPAADGKPLDVSRIYLAGATRTLAIATLQQYVNTAASATTGRLIETVPVEPLGSAGAAADTGEIRLRATLDIDNNGLLQLLFILESGVPLLDIETLSIRRISAGTDDQTEDRVRVDMQVRGYWRRQSA